MAENKVVYDTASFDGDVSPILPDGWKEGDNLLAESTDELEKLLADGQEADPFAGLENDDASAAPAAPTTSLQQDGASVPDAETKQPETLPDGAAEPEKPVSRKLTLKVNHEEKELDVGAMSDDELRALLQKGMAFDAMKDAEDKRVFRQVYKEQLDAGMTEAAARMIAKDAANGHVYALTDEEEQQAKEKTAPAPAQTAPAPATAQTRNLRAEVEQFRALYPEVKEFPDEVAKAVSNGAPVLTAYLAYKDKQSTKAAASLRKENTILKQNAANTAKAPVRGVTGGDNAAPKQKSLFEQGFDAGMNWR